MNTRISAPTKEEVIAARKRANLTQTEAAELVHLSSFTRWSEYERDDRNMDAARFELFLIKTGQHDQFGPKSATRKSRTPRQRP